MTRDYQTLAYKAYDNFGADQIFGRVLPHQLRTSKPTFLADQAEEFGVLETTFNYTNTPTVYPITVGWNYQSVPLVLMWHLGYKDSNQNGGQAAALGKMVGVNELYWNKSGLEYSYSFNATPSGTRTEYTYYIVLRQNTGLEGGLL